MEWVAQLVCAASESKQPRREGRGKIEVLFSLPLSLFQPLSLSILLSLIVYLFVTRSHI